MHPFKVVQFNGSSVYPRSWVTIPTTASGTWPLQRNPILSLVPLQLSSLPPASGNHQSTFCLLGLFWTFHIHGTVWDVTDLLFLVLSLGIMFSGWFMLEDESVLHSSLSLNNTPWCGGSHFMYPFTIWWVSVLLALFGSWQSCHEHPRMSFWVDICF